MKAKRFPSVSEELLQALEELFPDRLPDTPHTPVTQVAALVGQQDVIRFLRKQFEEQNRNILEGT